MMMMTRTTTTKQKGFKFNETKIQLVSFLSLKVKRYTHLTINAAVLGEKSNVIFCFVSDLWNTFRGKTLRVTTISYGDLYSNIYAY